MLITVHAHPKSKKPRIQKRSPGVFDVYVAEPPANGQSNKAIIRDLAKYLGVAQSELSIKRGHTSKVKYIQLNS